jgi:hypothetical protein
VFQELIRGAVAMLAGCLLLAHGALSLFDGYFGQSDVLSQALGAFVLALPVAVLAAAFAFGATRRNRSFSRVACGFAAGAMFATFVRWAIQPLLDRISLPAGPSDAWLALTVAQAAVLLALAVVLTVLVLRRADPSVLKRVLMVAAVLLLLPVAALVR